MYAAGLILRAAFSFGSELLLLVMRRQLSCRPPVRRAVELPELDLEFRYTPAIEVASHLRWYRTL